MHRGNQHGSLPVHATTNSQPQCTFYTHKMLAEKVTPKEIHVSHAYVYLDKYNSSDSLLYVLYRFWLPCESMKQKRGNILFNV